MLLGFAETLEGGASESSDLGALLAAVLNSVKGVTWACRRLVESLHGGADTALLLAAADLSPDEAPGPARARPLRLTRGGSSRTLQSAGSSRHLSRSSSRRDDLFHGSAHSSARSTIGGKGEAQLAELLEKLRTLEDNAKLMLERLKESEVRLLRASRAVRCACNGRHAQRGALVTGVTRSEVRHARSEVRL